MCGLTNIDAEVIDGKRDYARISADDFGSILLAVDGNLNIKNLHIDCTKVKTGLLIKGGVVTIKNCIIQGSKDSSVTEAFSISGDSEVFIENCVVTDFATAFSVSSEAKLLIKNSVIRDCNVGVHVQDSGTLTLERASVISCEENGILKNSSEVSNGFKILDFNEKEIAAK